MLVAPGLDVIVGMARRVRRQRRAGLDRQSVGAQVRRRVLQRQHVVERGGPVAVALGGSAEDEVEVPGGEPGRVDGGGNGLGGVGHVAPAEAGQHVGPGGLQAEGDAGHAGAAVSAEVRAVGVLGIALDRHLRAGRTRDGVEDAAEGLGVEAGRGAPSEENGGGRGEVARPEGLPHLAHAGVGVALHEMVAVGVGGEGAVVAALPAERDVDVDAEGGQSPAAERTERMRRSRCASMASVASSATSSAAGGGGPASTAARSPPRMRRRSTSAAGLM